MAPIIDKTRAAKDERKAAVVVAHPDDETLWAGGFVLTHSSWDWTIVTLCRGADPDRAPRFSRALADLGASGAMADLDDGPDQEALGEDEVSAAVLGVLPPEAYDLIITHSPFGEYTRHLRHEEAGRAVAALWAGGDLDADELWMFAYSDDGRRHLPGPVAAAHVGYALPEPVWRRKHWILESVYGFGPDSFEARICSRKEAFWRFKSPDRFEQWVMKGERL